MNLLRPHRLVLYRTAKRRSTMRLLARRVGRLPKDERAELLKAFERALRAEVSVE